VASIGIVIYHGVVGQVGNGISARVVERHMLDVGSLPVVSRQDEVREMEGEQRDPLSPDTVVPVDDGKSFGVTPSVLPRLGKSEPLDKDTRPDLAKQLRAVFLRFEERCSTLPKLPEPRSFIICVVLKDDE
jgi:hypothetical protein